MSLFGASDADGDTITQFEIRDNTPGGGDFRLNGVQQAASFQMAANQRANLQFVPTSATGSQDQIDIRAFDGYAWGDLEGIYGRCHPQCSAHRSRKRVDSGA